MIDILCQKKKQKILYFDANELYGHSMSQPLPFDEIEFDIKFKLEVTLKTPDASDIVFFLGVDSKYPDNMKD